MEDKIEILIAKYFVNQINEDELKELKNWINKDNNSELYKEYIDINYAVGASKANLYSEHETQKLENSLYIQKKSNTLLRIVLQYAAITIGIGIILYVFYNNEDSDKYTYVPLIDTREITLVLGDGSVKELVNDRESKLKDEHGESLGIHIGNEIVYNQDMENTKDKVVNNTLNVPFGKLFKLTLNDGTQVYLNSGSVLTYPQVFTDTKIRKVKLEGEAYFIVAKDEKRPFIVNSKNIDIQVLGTQFDISSYSQDKDDYVVLIEGSLALKEVSKEGTDLSQSIILKQGEKASLNRNGKESFIISDVNVGKYVAWRDGELFFQNDSFENILDKLIRRFNIKIKNNKHELSKMHFTGRFKTDNIFEILKAFQVHTAFDYKIKDNMIIIE